MVRHRFHLAFPVHDLEATRRFYVGVLGAGVGRTDERWIDLDMFGHQLTAHLVDEPHLVDQPRGAPPTNPVDGEDVPARHFGVILSLAEWAELRDRLAAAGVPFLIQPQIRFQGQPGEQATFFVLDPAGNALEFKAFADDAAVFRTV